MGNVIRHNEIIEEGVFDSSIRGAEILIAKLDEAKTIFQGVAGEMLTKMKAMNVTSPSGKRDVIGNSSEVERLKGEVSKLNSEIKKLSGNYETLKKSAKDYQAAIGKLTEKEREAIRIKKEQQKAEESYQRTQNKQMLSGAKKVASTAEYKQMLMYSKLVKAENNALDGSIAKVKASYARVVYEMNNFHKVGSRAYNDLQREANQYNNILKKHEQSHGVFGRSVGNYVTAIRNAWLGMTVALSGTYYTLKRWIMLNAELSDSMAAVRRTTGMTQDEVYSLNETLRNFNTRTSQTSLLDLAHVAGKLGIAKDEIAGFVKAADMIGVALGKDIGNNEEAINQLGRIVKIFNIDANEVGMEKALLKVGSALKDLGNASVAEEQNILDFTKRLGGIASAAKVPIDKIMGLAATYDILGQTMEVSSTATSQIWIAMVQKTEKFARIAGMSVKDFTDLMRKDFNEAFIAFVEGLQKTSGGMEELGEYFKGLGLDGRRIIGVMTVLSSHIQTFRDQMKISKESLEAGTTASEQFAIQNETLAASIDKLTKSLKNFVANSSTLRGITWAIKDIAAGVDDLADRFSSDKLRNLYSERRKLLKTIEIDPKIDKVWGRELAQKLQVVENEIKKLEELRASQERYNEQLKNTLKLYEQLPLGAKSRYNIQPQDRPFYWEEPQKKLAGVPEAPPSDADLNKVASYSDETDEERKARIEKYKKLIEDYYEFQRGLGFLTIDEIVEHEKQKLIEQGVWRKATEKERSEFIKQARIKAEDEINTRALEGATNYYDELIAQAKRNGEETYFIERDKYTFFMSKYREDELKYRQYLQKRLDLDKEFADKTLKRREQLSQDIANLDIENTRQSFQNRLDENRNKQTAIKNKKEKGGRGVSPVMLSDEDVRELNALVNEQNTILKEQADYEIRLIDEKIAAYDRLITVMLAYGKLSPEDNARLQKYQAERAGLFLKKEGIGNALESNMASNVESGSDASTGPGKIATWLGSREEWQNELAAITGVVQQFADQVSSILSSISQQYQQDQEAELAAVEARYEGEYEALDRAVANKSMSEQVAADKKRILERKQKAETEQITKEYAKKQQQIAIIQAIINTALGVTKAIAEYGLEGIALGAIVSLAGLAEVSTISSQQFAEGGYGEIDKKKGGVLVGNRHSRGGIKLPGIGEAEGGEYFAIINREATMRYANELPLLFDSINNQKYEQMFSRRGVNMNVLVNDKYGKEMLTEMKRKKTETRVYQEGNFMVYETGNYRLKTSVQ